MIAVRAFAERVVGVFGLEPPALAAVRALEAGGAEVLVWDEDQSLIQAARREGASARPWRDWPWPRLAAVVLGAATARPEVLLKARDEGVEVVSDVELFARELNGAPLIAVTGTSGSSATAAVIGHVLAQNGFDVRLGGGDGRPVLELGLPGARTIYVIELSHRIDLAPSLAPEVSVLCGLAPDGAAEDHVALYTRLLKQTVKTGHNVVGVDDPQSAAIFTRLTSNGGAPCTAVSVGKVLGRGVFVLDGLLYDAQNEHAAKIMDLAAAEHLRDAREWRHAALAYAAAKHYAKGIAEAIRSFPGRRAEATAQLMGEASWA